MKRVHKNISQHITKVTAERRESIELLRSRVGLLTGEDRMLMTMYIENGNSFRQISRLSGINEGRISRRIHKVTERLMNGEYITCLRNRNSFEEGELDIAKDYLIAGLSIKEIAKRRGSSYYGVRKTLKKIRRVLAPPQVKEAVGA